MSSKYKYDLAQRIFDARKLIRNLFIDQCKNGQQTIALNNEEVTACGQFIGETARALQQRGLHGTAAALKVISMDLSEDSKVLIPKLVKYLENRESYEIECREDKEQAISKCKFDFLNVMKLSEVLLSLKSVPQSIHDTSKVASVYADRLRSCFKEDKGWSYFVDDTEPPQILATSYAFLALASLGDTDEVVKSEQFLIEHLRKRYHIKSVSKPEDTDIIIDVGCLYALTFRGQSTGISSNKDLILKRSFSSIWKRLEPLMDEDLEGNIEYWYKKTKTSYIRVPWQLYLLVLAAYHSFHWRFSCATAQKKLKHTLDIIDFEGFRYPHSGKMLSSRTHAILWEVLTYLEDKLSKNKVFSISLFLDHCRNALSSFWSRVATAVFALAIIVYVLVKWCQSASAEKIAPGIIATLLLWFLTWFRKTK